MTVMNCVIAYYFILGRRIYTLCFFGKRRVGRRKCRSHRARAHATYMQHAGNLFSAHRAS
jgi:hypothetical protein